MYLYWMTAKRYLPCKYFGIKSSFVVFDTGLKMALTTLQVEELQKKVQGIISKAEFPIKKYLDSRRM